MRCCGWKVIAPLQGGRRPAGSVQRPDPVAAMPARSWRWSGQSGAGKSSLLHIAGLLEAPTGGEIYHRRAWRPRACRTSERTRIRRDTIGFVYQAHHLLPEFDALENVVLPQMIAGKSRAEAAKEAERLLTVLGLGAAADAPAVAIVGRRAAARRHRPRPGQPAAHASGRRAHRQSRSAHRGRGVRCPDRHHPGARPGRADRHPQFRAGRRGWTARCCCTRAGWSKAAEMQTDKG